MGLFSSPVDIEVDKVTDEKLSVEPWNLIMELCDRAGADQQIARDYFRSIMRRINHPDPHVVRNTLTLLDACISNCGLNFHLAVASREFEKEYKRILLKHTNQPPLFNKMKMLLKKWAENEFKDAPQLNLIPTLYLELKREGYDFTDHSIPKKTAPYKADPNFAASQQEEDDIAKAIELSLKDTSSSPKAKSYSSEAASSSANTSSLYPSMSLTRGASAPAQQQQPAKEPRKVRALYDFEDAEDNELKFLAGEIIHVLDDSDPNWWKGFNQRGEGLFPANFVTADLNAEPEETARIEASKAKKGVQFNESEGAAAKIDYSNQVVEINEEKIDRLLHLLHEANPEDDSGDTEEMLQLEALVNRMGPLIDNELEKIDRKHAQMTQLSRDLVVAFNLYHKLMKEPEPMPYMPQYSLGHPNQMMYGQMGTMPHGSYQMAPGAMYSMPPGGLPCSMAMPNQPGSVIMGHPASNMHPNVFPPSQLPNTQRPIMSTQIQNGQQPHQQYNGVVPGGPVPQGIPQSSAPPVQQNLIPQNSGAMQSNAHGTVPTVPLQNPGVQQPGPLPAAYGQNGAVGGIAPNHPQQQPYMNPAMMPHSMPVGMTNGVVDQTQTPSYIMSPQHQHAQQQQQHQQSQAQQHGIMPQVPQVHQMMNNYGQNMHQPPLHMGSGSMMAQPVTSMIGSNDSKSNIPVYQQQR